MPKTIEKKRPWGRERDWSWMSRERFEKHCTRHARIIVRRVFHGRRVTVVEDIKCRRRAMIHRSWKNHMSRERMTSLKVTIDTAPMELKP